MPTVIVVMAVVCNLHYSLCRLYPLFVGFSRTESGISWIPITEVSQLCVFHSFARWNSVYRGKHLILCWLAVHCCSWLFLSVDCIHTTTCNLGLWHMVLTVEDDLTVSVIAIRSYYLAVRTGHTHPVDRLLYSATKVVGKHAVRRMEVTK